jgi:hypothetical protein
MAERWQELTPILELVDNLARAAGLRALKITRE